MRRGRRITLTTAAALCTMLAACAPAGAKAAFTRVFTLGVGPFANEALARTADGSLHIMYQTTSGSSAVPNGLATNVVSPSGKLSPPVQALSGWTPSIPGLTALPGGGLLAAFGAVSPQNVSALWTIASGDGGQTWSAPAQTPTSVVQAYGANLNAQALGSLPILTLTVSGGVSTQQGTADNAPTSLLVDSSDNFAANANSAVDASGQVIVSWDSLAGSGGDFMRAAAPQLGSVQKAPGVQKNELQLAARTGGGVFAAYTSDQKHVRLVRYGGGSVAVPALKAVTPGVMGVASGPAGRIWVMWGDDHGIAVTRSNMAVTRFEPVQQLNPGSFTLYRVYGDGQLGPLDLFVDQIPTSDIHAPGGFYTRVLPLLSAAPGVIVHHNKKGAVTGYGVNVRVTDAGDAVSGAAVKLGGKTVKTGKSGVAHFALGPGAASAQLSVTAATYRRYSVRLKL